MAKSNNDAGLNADDTEVSAEASSAGRNGKGAADSGAHGDEENSVDSWAEALAGNTVAAQLDALAKAEGTEKPVKRAGKPSAAQKPAQARVSEESDDDDEKDESDAQSVADKPVLPEDEDESESDDADDAGDGVGSEDLKELAKKAKALEKDNFKAREKARTLAAELEEKKSKVLELERQIKEGGAVVSDMPAGFEKVKTIADIEQMTEQMERDLEWAEDHVDGFTGKDAEGNEVEYTPQQVRDYRRSVKAKIKLAEEARKTITKRTERRTAATEKARVKYPFVLDPASSRQALIREIETEHPEISSSPERDLLLGRLTVAKLIESGAFEIVRKTTQKPAETPKPKVTLPTPPPARRIQKPAAESEDWAMSLARISMPAA